MDFDFPETGGSSPDERIDNPFVTDQTFAPGQSASPDEPSAVAPTDASPQTQTPSKKGWVKPLVAFVAAMLLMDGYLGWSAVTMKKARDVTFGAPESITLRVGESVSPEYTVDPAGAECRLSVDGAAVTLQDGTLTARQEGDSLLTLTAAYNKLAWPGGMLIGYRPAQTDIPVHVDPARPDYSVTFPIDMIQLKKGDIAVVAKETLLNDIIVTPSYPLTVEDLTFSSDDIDVMSISEDGKIEATGVGSTQLVICLRVDGQDYYGSIPVVVS